MRLPSTKALLTGALAVVLAGISMANAISNILVERQPGLALKVWPLNGDAQTRIANAIYIQARQAERNPELAHQARSLKSEAVRIARLSLSQEPLNPIAFRIIADTPDLPPQSRRLLLKTASAMTRRDSLLQVAIIDLFARDGNDKEALAHYDALLRRRSVFRDAAGQGLAKALAAPELVPPISKMLSRSPPWKSLLFHYLLLEPGSWDSFIALHYDFEGRDIIPVETSASFARKLVYARRIRDAIEISRIVNGGVMEPASQIVVSEFTISPSFPGNWDVPDSAAASLVPLREGGALLSLSRGASGVIARRLISLKPGRYWSTVMINDDNDLQTYNEPHLPQSSLTCTNQAEPSRSATNMLLVDKSCEYQWLSIFLEDASPIDADVIISKITVKAIE